MNLAGKTRVVPTKIARQISAFHYRKAILIRE
jgi:hypothetical protein